jgi:phosphopantetheinyl transferase (holo-ACP synthase)
LVQRVLQNRFDALVAAGSRQQRPLRRRFHTGRRVAFGQANDAEATAVAHLRMRPVAHDPRKQLARGKPHVISDQDIRFSVSHTTGAVAIAITRNAAVGVDIELIREVQGCRKVADRYFAASEAVSLRAVSDLDFPKAFLVCWTRKEACVKASGAGLGAWLRDFAVSLEPEQPARLIYTKDVVRIPPDLLLHGLEFSSQYVGCIARPGPVFMTRVIDATQGLARMRPPSIVKGTVR